MLTLIAENQEDLKALIRKVKEQSEKMGLQLSIKNTAGTIRKITNFTTDGEDFEVMDSFCPM